MHPQFSAPNGAQSFARGPVSDPGGAARRFSLAALLTSLAIIPLNTGVYFHAITLTRAHASPWMTAFALLAAAQVVAGTAGLVAGIAYAVARGQAGRPRGGAVLLSIAGALGALSGAVGALMGFALSALGSGMGGAWGRPLRLRGRVVHPELTRGTDWTQGDSPDASGLDADTRAALAALWLHDAQKEHASVPAFARVAWMLTAMGAPAELVDRTLVAAREEVDHTRLCFALAAGYGGSSHTVEPMPDLLLGGALDIRGDAFEHLALESLKDGCLLEDYNADVAGECAAGCEEPVTRRVLRQIAVEERAHAELSWSILAWCLARGGLRVKSLCEREIERLGRIERPTAASREKAALVARADPDALRAHGRLPDARWAAIYATRLDATTRRLTEMLRDAETPAAAAA